MKWVIYFVFVLLYISVTIFGLGPVLLADGTLQERIMTLGVVLGIYFFLTLLLYMWRRNKENR
ncbi:DUF6954 family protein [Neobacillus sp. D3-1R]|uniref:DUF6954 family protein n=1 Tax=Neobacillus sp. D3-1R TaxID=3445778 RepID=UPI003FA03FA5